MSYPDRRPRGQTLAEAFAWFVPVPHESGCLLWPAATMVKGYGEFKHEKVVHYAHVVAYELAHGPVPDGMQVDHIDCVSRACVNDAHLRAVTHKQNQENRRGASSHNRSGIRGVVEYRPGRWAGRVRHNGIEHYRYGFTNPGDAVAWVIAKRLALFTHNSADRRAS